MMPTTQKRNVENSTLNERLIFRCDRADALELRAKAARQDVSLSELIRQELFDREEDTEAED
jgi:predicted HicB family RNase H-like nuclease